MKVLCSEGLASHTGPEPCVGCSTAAGAGAPLPSQPRNQLRYNWAIVASLVATAKLNGVEPQAWLTDVLERVVSGRTKAHQLARLLPWTWKAERSAAVRSA